MKPDCLCHLLPSCFETVYVWSLFLVFVDYIVFQRNTVNINIAPHFCFTQSQIEICLLIGSNVEPYWSEKSGTFSEVSCCVLLHEWECSFCNVLKPILNIIYSISSIQSWRYRVLFPSIKFYNSILLRNPQNTLTTHIGQTIFYIFYLQIIYFKLSTSSIIATELVILWYVLPSTPEDHRVSNARWICFSTSVIVFELFVFCYLVGYNEVAIWNKDTFIQPSLELHTVLEFHSYKIAVSFFISEK